MYFLDRFFSEQLVFVFSFPLLFVLGTVRCIKLALCQRLSARKYIVWFRIVFVCVTGYYCILPPCTKMPTKDVAGQGAQGPYPHSLALNDL